MGNTSRKTAPSIRNPESIYQRETRKIVESNFTKITNGVLLPGVVLTTGTTRVSHLLGRNYTGFIVVDKTVTCDVWRDATDTARPQDAIPLRASAPATVTLWVF